MFHSPRRYFLSSREICGSARWPATPLSSFPKTCFIGLMSGSYADHSIRMISFLKCKSSIKIGRCSLQSSPIGLVLAPIAAEKDTIKFPRSFLYMKTQSYIPSDGSSMHPSVEVTAQPTGLQPKISHFLPQMQGKFLVPLSLQMKIRLLFG